MQNSKLIRVSQQVYDYLKRRGRFGESFDKVLKRELDLNKPLPARATAAERKQYLKDLEKSIKQAGEECLKNLKQGENPEPFSAGRRRRRVREL